MLRRIVSICLLGLTMLTPASAQETLEIPNWPAPPFWSAPVKWEKGADVGPMEVDGAGPLATPFIAVPPCRIADTRGNGFTGQAGPPALLANTTRTFQVGGTVFGVPNQCGIAPFAIAVSFQFTVTNMTSGGNLIAWPSGPPPTTSVLNWNANSVAIGSGTVVQLSGVTSSLNVQINAPIGQAADVIIDVNGYYLFGGLDSFYVNENQTNSVNSSMIADGAILNLDINPTAAIADTKLATIATAGKVADTALSSNVSKLGSSIDTAEISNDAVTAAKIPNITRSVPIPLTSLTDCGTGPGAFLDFTSTADAKPDLGTFGGVGSRVFLLFDATAGSPDQDYEVCSQLHVPTDYASGGEFRVSATLTTAPVPATEVLNCSAGRNFSGHGASGSVQITTNSNAFYTCTPTLTGLAAGDVVDFFFSVTSDSSMDNIVRVNSIEFRYVASQ